MVSSTSASGEEELTRSGNYRKKLLIAFGFTGAASSMLFLLVVPKIYLFGPLLVVIGVTCLGSSFVLLNSFLPLLVANHPLIQSRTGQFNNESPSIPLESMSRNRDSTEDRSYPRATIDAKSTTAELQLSSNISSRGVGIGYCAAVFVQVLSIVILYILSKKNVSSTLPLRLVLFMVGLWWFAFTIPSIYYLRPRPGPPLPTTSHRGRLRSLLAYLSFAWLSVFRTVKLAFQLRQMVVFLIAWFLLSDAVATVSGTAILFARTELKMGTVPIALLSITATSSGIAGAFIWPILSRRFRLATNRTIVACILLMEIVPLYGLLGYVPFIQAWGVGGLQKAWEIFPLAFIYGFVMGGLSSYCRSFFGLLIPPGSEAAFYALYAITDKGSSAVGPAVVGMIVDRTGSIRPAFVFLTVLIALPAPLVWMVDAKKGQVDAVRMARVIGKIGDAEVDVNGVVDGIQESEGLMRDHD
jgi:UMF1 family MFS transporter